MRTPKELLIASKEFASEYRWLSWWHLWSTLGVLVGLVAAAISDLPWGIRAASSVVAGLVGVRLFIIYHDYQHRAILRDSPIAGFLMGLYGVIMLNPPSVWNRSHDQHHRRALSFIGVSNSDTAGVEEAILAQSHCRDQQHNCQHQECPKLHDEHDCHSNDLLRMARPGLTQGYHATLCAGR